MNEKSSMTALVSAFSRAYHNTYPTRIFSDTIAHLLLTPEEYQQISKMMSDGISFFNPSFKGTPDEALRWIVDHQLSPSPLGRAAFTEKKLKEAVITGCTQYLILAAGYDTFAYRQPAWAESLQIFEIDHPLTAAEKKERLLRAKIPLPANVHYIDADFTQADWQQALITSPMYQPDQPAFCSLLGLIYYLSKEDFKKMLLAINKLCAGGSLLAFDYPEAQTYSEDAENCAKAQLSLAQGAGETMLAAYTENELKQLLQSCGFKIKEHLVPECITQTYFSAYNAACPDHPMQAFEHVNYCLAVKSH